MVSRFGYVSLEELLDWVRLHPLSSGRILPVCVWGAKGIGKCSAGDTQVLVNHAWTEIQTLWDTCEGTIEADEDRGEWKIPDVPLTVIALDEATGAMREQRVTRLYRQRVREIGRTVTLDGQRSITMTSAHRLRGVSEWVRDIAPGDRVAIPARIPDPADCQCDDVELATLLGWQIAEGWENSNQGYVSISQADRPTLERIRAAASRVGDRYGIDMNSMPITDVHRGGVLHISSVAYRAFLESHGYEWGHRSAQKRVPAFIARGSRDVARAFLRAYLAAEAHVNNVGGVEVSSASRMLLEDVSALLLRFGIWLRISPKRGRATNGTMEMRTYYRGFISGSSLRSLATEVGIDDAEKEQRLKHNAARSQNDNVDLVPLRDLTARAHRITGLPTKHLGFNSHFTGTGVCQGMVREKALGVADDIRAVVSGSAASRWEAGSKNNHSITRTREAFAVAADNASELTEIADEITRRARQEVRFVTVQSVTPVMLDGYVYDLEVQDDHNYVAAGLITHNTQQIRAFAEARGLDMVTYHPAHDSQGSDIVGIPYIDEKNRKTVYAKPEWLPNEAGNGGVLFIDEINRAKLEVIQGLMEVLGEGEISQSGWKLPEGWQVVAAANPAGKDYAVSVLDDAMINRMINYAPGFDAPGWVRWAERAGVSPMVVDVALQNPDLVDSGESDLPFEVRPSATARSLEYLAALYEQGMEPRMLDTIAQGLVGKQMAEAMIEQHFESERAMTGIEIAQGGWEETLERWIADGRDDYIRASGERLIALLGNGDPGRSRIAKVAVSWMRAIPEDLQREFIRVLAESSPPWFAFFMENPDLGAAQMIPENLASLRKPSNRQMVGRRQARSEARRQAERIARERDQAAAPMADDIPGDIPGDIPLTSF